MKNKRGRDKDIATSIPVPKFLRFLFHRRYADWISSNLLSYYTSWIVRLRDRRENPLKVLTDISPLSIANNVMSGHRVAQSFYNSNTRVPVGLFIPWLMNDLCFRYDPKRFLSIIIWNTKFLKICSIYRIINKSRCLPIYTPFFSVTSSPHPTATDPPEYFPRQTLSPCRPARESFERISNGSKLSHVSARIVRTKFRLPKVEQAAEETEHGNIIRADNAATNW